MKNLSQYSLCPGQDSNRKPPEQKFRVLPIDQHVRGRRKKSTCIVLIRAGIARSV
jgi:hypothetical protein